MPARGASVGLLASIFYVGWWSECCQSQGRAGLARGHLV